MANEVVIVGGGVAGCATGYYLAKAGVGVTIIEREGVGTQASGYSAGGLNPLQGAGIPGPLGPLAMESFRMHRSLWGPLGDESGVDFHPKTVSGLRLASDDSEIEELQETLDIFEATEDFSAHWIDAQDVREVEPRVASGFLRALYTYGNAALDSYLFTLALSKAAQIMGATVRQGAVTGLERTTGDRASGIVLEDGELDCDVVVLASGPWSAEAERWIGSPIPVEPYKGEILRMDLPGPPLASDLSSGHTSLYQRAQGLVWIGATEERRGFDREPSQSARQTLIDGAIELMPAMSEAKLVKHTACLRPLTPDWLPIIGRAPNLDNVYLATGAGKKGILISTGMGKAVADLITDGRTALPVEPFAPERFA